MAIEIDHHCGFHQQEEHFHARHHFFGHQLLSSTSYAFRAKYRGRIHGFRERLSAMELEGMHSRQQSFPVLMMRIGKRAWWWFHDQFYSVTEPYEDPVVIKGLILQWQQRRARKAAKAEATATGEPENRQHRPPKQRSPKHSPRMTPTPTAQAPWQLLEVDRSASGEALKKAYLRQISLYHPDKVSHLGTELQKLAAERTRLINEAYAAMKGGAA